MEESVLVENKLRAAWSAPEFVPLLTRERLAFVAKEFSTFELSIKLRVLLALLSMSVTQLAAAGNQVHEVLKSAAADSDEWVRVILALVRKRLPTSEDVRASAPDAVEKPKEAADGAADDGAANDGATNDGPANDGPVEEAKKAAAKLTEQQTELRDGDVEVALEDSATRFLHEAIRAIAKEVEASNTSWPRPGDVEAKPRMSAEFVPLEWPFLSPHLLPQDIDIEDNNRHFKPAASQDEVLRRIEEQRLQQQKQQQQEEEEARQKKRKAKDQTVVTGVSAAAAAAAQAHQHPQQQTQPAQKPTTPAADTVQYPDEVPEGMRKILRDPENTNLDDDARRKVIAFYCSKDDPNRPKQGVATILLRETRTLEGTEILVVQVNLKLDYATGTAKRATSKKKYKIG